MFYLLDLERTILTGVPCFWKGNRHGYTYSPTEAGIFSTVFAEKICKQDINERTIMIKVEIIDKILERVTRTI
jgi:hypothetical protein